MDVPSPINRIVVAYDGSDLARQAFAYAVMLAERTGSSVLAVHVTEKVLTETPAGLRSGEFAMFAEAVADDDDAADERRKHERIRAIEDQFDDMDDYCIDRRVNFEGIELEGDLADELLATAQPGDLLAVGQKGRMAKAGFGSMARALVRHAPCPVLMAGGDLWPVMRIVAAHDGSEPSRRAVRFARDLAQAAKLSFSVLSVGGVTWSADETLLASQEIAGDAQMLAVGPGDEPEAAQILRAAQHAGLAILVIGAFPESWLHQLIFGDATNQVLQRLHAPVILVH